MLQLAAFPSNDEPMRLSHVDHLCADCLVWHGCHHLFHSFLFCRQWLWILTPARSFPSEDLRSNDRMVKDLVSSTAAYQGSRWCEGTFLRTKSTFMSLKVMYQRERVEQKKYKLCQHNSQKLWKSSAVTDFYVVLESPVVFESPAP